MHVPLPPVAGWTLEHVHTQVLKTKQAPASPLVRVLPMSDMEPALANTNPSHSWPYLRYSQFSLAAQSIANSHRDVKIQHTLASLFCTCLLMRHAYAPEPSLGKKHPVHHTRLRFGTSFMSSRDALGWCLGHLAKGTFPVVHDPSTVQTEPSCLFVQTRHTTAVHTLPQERRLASSCS